MTIRYVRMKSGNLWHIAKDNKTLCGKLYFMVRHPEGGEPFQYNVCHICWNSNRLKNNAKKT